VDSKQKPEDNVMDSKGEHMIDFRAVGRGFLTWCVATFGLMLATALLLTRLEPQGVAFVLFILGLAAYVGAGYVVGRNARVVPMRQAAVLGAILVLANALMHTLIVASDRAFYAIYSAGTAHHHRTYLPSWSMFGWWLISIPLVLVGARLAIGRSTLQVREVS
jgi:hypothetical protein